MTFPAAGIIFPKQAGKDRLFFFLSREYVFFFTVHRGIIMN